MVCPNVLFKVLSPVLEWVFSHKNSTDDVDYTPLYPLSRGELKGCVPSQEGTL